MATGRDVREVRRERSLLQKEKARWNDPLKGSRKEKCYIKPCSFGSMKEESKIVERTLRINFRKDGEDGLLDNKGPMQHIKVSLTYAKMCAEQQEPKERAADCGKEGQKGEGRAQAAFTKKGYTILRRCRAEKTHRRGQSGAEDLKR